MYTQYTAASLQAQTLASETSWTWATPTPDYAYYTYLNEIYYTPPPSLPLVEISPETPAPRFGNDRRQDSEPPIYVAPEIAAVYAWPLDENQQAVLDIDSWNMWNNEPVCFWSNMLNIYLQAANLTCESFIIIQRSFSGQELTCSTQQLIPMTLPILIITILHAIDMGLDQRNSGGVCTRTWSLTQCPQHSSSFTILGQAQSTTLQHVRY